MKTVCKQCKKVREVKYRNPALLCKGCANKKRKGMIMKKGWKPSDEWIEKLRQRKLGTKHSEETKEKMSKKSRQRWSNLEEREKQSKRTKKYIKENGHSKGMLGKRHSEDTKKKMSQNQPKGKNHYRYGKSAAHGKGEWYIRKDKTKIWMRSSYEIAFAKWLDEKKLIWNYEPKRFYLNNRTYAPDFYIKEWNSWIEIKGWFHKRHRETIRQFRECNPNENLLVLTKPLLKSMKVLYN